MRGLVYPLMFLLLFAACSRQANQPVKRYQLRGEIKSLDPQAKTATIQHEKIGDWMEAMTMEYPVKDPAEFAKLKVGQRITATVFVREADYWIGEIRSEGATEGGSEGAQPSTEKR